MKTFFSLVLANLFGLIAFGMTEVNSTHLNELDGDCLLKSKGIFENKFSHNDTKLLQFEKMNIEELENYDPGPIICGPIYVSCSDAFTVRCGTALELFIFWVEAETAFCGGVQTPGN
jgi:hypothetical protein